MRRTADIARGKWKGILQALGVKDDFLTGKHGPCPFCGGKDRFRFDNDGGSGSFFCSQCGAGNGFDFLIRVHGWDFKTTAAEVDKVVGNVSPESPKRRMDDAQRRQMLNELWLGGAPIVSSDLAGRYLASRGVPMPGNPNCLRFVIRCPAPDKTFRPALVALVSDATGAPATLHRTFLGEVGKANMEQPRALMPGDLPEGAAIRLAKHDGILGVAEGLETALAVTRDFGIPCWSLINAANMQRFLMPEGVRELHIFGDNDAKFGGQAAAFQLAHRLATKPAAPEVKVHVPDHTGCDWADKREAA